MKSKSMSLVPCLATVMLTLGSASAATVINGFALTTSTHAAAADWDAAVKSEFGSSAVVASFESIKAAFANDIPSLVTLLAGTVGNVTYNGGQFMSAGRSYFLVYHGATVPGGFGVHDKIGDVSTGNQTSLGSWTDDRRIISAIPEPSTAMFSLLALLAASARRSR